MFDAEGIAKSIVDGRLTIEKVPNVFGVPLRAYVRTKVLEQVPDFNFNLPEARLKAVGGVLTQLTKQRGAMGSFVKNMTDQVTRVNTIMEDIVSRVNLRAIDLPKRELLKSLKGSGNEAIIEAYMAEISNEIGKISTGSSQSIRELSTEAQARWNKIHDPNLSFKELSKILTETQHMGQIRLDSVDNEIFETESMLKDVTKPTRQKPQAPRFTIKKVSE
jgi:hypothetical protein